MSNIQSTKKYEYTFLCRTVYKSVLLGILIVTFILFLSNFSSVNAKSNFDYSKYDFAIEEALEVIQPLNQEKLDIYVDDIYNVVDTQGNLEGYSMGYFVDDEPYGYAIYSIESSSIREFVFCPDVENLYNELEEKAELCDEVDEDNLINGIVYDGGIDYCTYDKDGNKVRYDDKLQSSYSGENTCDENVEDILESKYVAPESRVGDPQGLVSRLGYWDIYNSNSYRGWNIVPDSGLAMITIEASSQKLNRYACTINSATGLLNWLGYNNVWNNYLDLWNNVYTHPNNITEDPNSHFLYGGYFLDDVASYINSSYFANSTTRAYMDKSVEFSEIIDSINGSAIHGEKTPFSMSIWVTQIDEDGNYIHKPNGDLDVWAHTVTCVSYMKTSEKNYVGIFNGWGLDDNDNEIDDNTGLKANVNNSTSYLSVRYIDFNDLKYQENVHIEAMFLKNVSSKNIKEVNKSYVSGNNIELSCYVPNGTKYVFFPTWTVVGNGTDVVWHSGNIQYGTVASVSIDLNTYNKASGYYATDIYAFDENMNQLACYGTVLNNINSDISNVKTSNKTIKGYTIICNLPTGTDRVAFPTWSSVNNQDDLIWYDGKVKNNNGNLQGEITIDVANHKNDGGLYITHIYAYDKYDKLIASDVSGRATITDRKQITDAKITNVTSNSYKVTCKIPTGTAYVWFPTWTYNNGQDDLICYDAVVNGETAYLTIYKSKHNNESGLYYTHIYAFNSKGEKIGFENVQVSLN